MRMVDSSGKKSGVRNEISRAAARKRPTTDRQDSAMRLCYAQLLCILGLFTSVSMNNEIESCRDEMASADIIQLEALLAPVPGDKPTGVDLRLDASPTSDYYKLKDARFAARAKEREIDTGTDISDLPEWRVILELAPKVLTAQSKDLEV